MDDSCLVTYGESTAYDALTAAYAENKKIFLVGEIYVTGGTTGYGPIPLSYYIQGSNSIFVFNNISMLGDNGKIYSYTCSSSDSNNGWTITEYPVYYSYSSNYATYSLNADTVGASNIHVVTGAAGSTTGTIYFY